MQAGRLIETIQVEKFTSTVNEYGTPENKWAWVCDRRAEKVEQTTAEYIRNFGASDEEVVIFRARYHPGIQNDCRVVWNNQYFNIRQITPLGRRLKNGIEMRCVRIKT